MLVGKICGNDRAAVNDLILKVIGIRPPRPLRPYLEDAALGNSDETSGVDRGSASVSGGGILEKGIAVTGELARVRHKVCAGLDPGIKLGVYNVGRAVRGEGTAVEIVLDYCIPLLEEVGVEGYVGGKPEGVIKSV